MIQFNHPDLQDHTTLNKTFADLNLQPFYVQALASIEYIKPTTVQFYSITEGLQNKNLIVQSKSGTGKTLAFISIIINRLLKKSTASNSMQVKYHVKKAKVIILEPTRELAVQVYQFLRKVLAAEKNIKVAEGDQLQHKSIMRNITACLSIGGLPIEDDRKNMIEIGFDIVVGTVGRIFELVSRNVLKLQQVQMIVLDEGDKLFEQKDCIKRVMTILSKVKQPQILVYSATYNELVFSQFRSIGEFTFVKTVAAKENMKVKISDVYGAEDVTADKQQLSLDNITKLYVNIVQTDKSVFSQKLNTIKLVLKELQYKKCLVFVEKKTQIPEVHSYLKELNPLLIHGSLSQSARIKLLNQLNHHKIIITSDLLARGIDILVDLIVLFNSGEGQNFWHRIGRTGRIGRKGVVISLDKVQNWQEYTTQTAMDALKQVDIEPKQQIFGQFMTELGRWHDVDASLELQNINKYRYFDEQKFKAQIISELSQEIEVETIQIAVNESNQPQQQSLQQKMHTLVNCKECLQEMLRITKLTAYQFQLRKHI